MKTKTHSYEAIMRYEQIVQDKKDIRLMKRIRNSVLLTLASPAIYSLVVHGGL